MKISSLLLVSAFASQALTGCSVFKAERSPHIADGFNGGKDTCGRSYFEDLVGTAFDDINLRDDVSLEMGQMDNGSGTWTWKNRTYYLRVFDPRTLLPGEERVVLADFSAKRLNVFLTDDGMIKSLGCG